MLTQLLALLTTWLGAAAEESAYNAVKVGSVRGAERAIQELTGDTMTAAEWFARGRIESSPLPALETDTQPADELQETAKPRRTRKG